MEYPSGTLDGEGSAELVVSPAATLARPSGVTREQREEIAERWLRAKGARSEHTEARYRRDIRSYFDWADGKRFDVFAMLPWQLGEYTRDLKDGCAGELKASTRAGRLSAVSSFYRFVQRNVERNSYLPNPAEYIDRPKYERRKSKTRGLNADELEAVRAEARKRGPQEYALVQLLVGSGLRISEALEADTHHLKRDGGEWYLEVERKGEEDRVPVQVPLPAVRALHRYNSGRRGPLFLDRQGKRMTRQAASNRIRFIALAAGVTGKSITPHSLRHTFATISMNEGVPIRDVQVQMGHSSTETTANYDRANRERNNPAVAAMARVIADNLPDGPEA